MLNTILQTTTPVDSTSTFKANIEAAITSLSTKSTSEILSGLTEELINFGLKVLAAILIYIIGKWIIKKLKKIVTHILEKKGTDKSIITFLDSFIGITLTIILVVIIIGTVGINTSSFAALLAAGGVAVGFALSGTLQNFAGGIMLLLFKPFKAGDFIESMGQTGTVSEVNIASTKLVTVDNRTIIIPNGALFNNTIDNFSTNSIRKLEWLVDVEYGVDSLAVKTLIQNILASDSRILDLNTGAKDAPLVELNALRDSSVQFVARVWVKKEHYWAVNFSINERIYNELPKNNINFPFPQLDVNIKK